MVVKIGGFLDQLFTLMNNITILERFVHPFQSYRVHFMVPYKFHAFTVGVDDWQAMQILLKAAIIRESE